MVEVMEEIFEYFKPYIVKEEKELHESTKTAYSYINLQNDKQYLVVYYDDHKIIKIVFPCVFYSYTPVASCPYGEGCEGYWFKSKDTKYIIRGPSHWYDEDFSFFELDGKFVIDDFTTFFKTKFSYEILEDENDEDVCLFIDTHYTFTCSSDFNVDQVSYNENVNSESLLNNVAYKIKFNTSENIN